MEDGKPGMKMQLIQDGPVKYVPDVEVDRFPFLMGRHATCDYQMFHPMVSRRHCRLIKTEKGVAVHDLSSCNGTYVNGKRLREPTYLKHGDEIRLGCVAYRVSLAN